MPLPSSKPRMRKREGRTHTESYEVPHTYTHTGDIHAATQQGSQAVSGDQAFRADPGNQASQGKPGTQDGMRVWNDASDCARSQGIRAILTSNPTRSQTHTRTHIQI